MKHPVLAIMILLLAIQPMSGCVVEQFRPEPYEMRSVFNSTDMSQGEYKFNVPERAESIAINIEAEVAVSVPTGQTGAVLGISVNVSSPAGASYEYVFNGSGERSDTVLEPAAGEWTITIIDYTGQNKASISVEAYSPKYSDWSWWKFWEN
jgi:hypothetical protein